MPMSFLEQSRAIHIMFQICFCSLWTHSCLCTVSIWITSNHKQPCVCSSNGCNHLNNGHFVFWMVIWKTKKLSIIQIIHVCAVRIWITSNKKHINGGYHLNNGYCVLWMVIWIANMMSIIHIMAWITDHSTISHLSMIWIPD